MFAIIASALFVLIWSTGFIVARAVIPHASPELVLAVRLCAVTAILTIAALVARQSFPRGRRMVLHLAAGAMLHGLYLTISWWAVAEGLPAGIMALLGATQPLMVAVASMILLGERLPVRGWGGLGIAIAGVVCVLMPAIERSGTAALAVVPVVAGIISVIAMTGGTMIQRGEIGGDPILMSGAMQNLGGAIVAIIAALIVDEWRWDNAPMLWLGLSWSTFGLSAGGLSLLVWLVRHQGPTRMSMLLLLVPPFAAIEAWLLFDEKLSPVQLVGFVLALVGVLLGRSRPKPAELTEPA